MLMPKTGEEYSSKTPVIFQTARRQMPGDRCLKRNLPEIILGIENDFMQKWELEQLHSILFNLQFKTKG
jgi:hypothetical protein